MRSASFIANQVFRIGLILIGVFANAYATLITEVPFCSGRSQIVPISETEKLVLDGSTSAIYTVATNPIGPGTSCTCSITPATDLRSVHARLVTPSNPEHCTKTLRVALDSEFDYWYPECANQSFPLLNVGRRTIQISVNFIGELTVVAKHDSYKVWLDVSTDAFSRNETEFRVSCLAPTATPYSTTSPSSTTATISLSSSTTPFVSTSSTASNTTPSPSGVTSDPSQNTTRAYTPVAGNSEGQSSTVVIVCIIIGAGLSVATLILCLLCYVTRRLNKRSKKIERRSARRLYRRICHTIRNLPDALHIRRPLPPPPPEATKPEMKLKPRSHVFATESGPYASINSSVKHPIRMLTQELDGDKDHHHHTGDISDYEYLYPVCSKKKSDANDEVMRTLSVHGDYLTPIRATRRENKTNVHEVCPGDNVYVNTILPANAASTSGGIPMQDATVSIEPEAVVKDANQASSHFGYMRMGITREDGLEHDIHCHDSDTKEFRASVENGVIGPETNIPHGAETGVVTGNHDQLSSQDIYINVDNNDVTKSSSIPAVADNTSNSHDELSGYLSQCDYIDMQGGNIERTNDESELSCNGNPVNPTAFDSHETNGNIESETHTEQSNSDYMSMDAIERVSNPAHQASFKDRTFPNLMKLNMASIKTMVTPGTVKKRGPEVKPKPKRYVRNATDA